MLSSEVARAQAAAMSLSLPFPSFFPSSLTSPSTRRHVPHSLGGSLLVIVLILTSLVYASAAAMGGQGQSAQPYRHRVVEDAVTDSMIIERVNSSSHTQKSRRTNVSASQADAWVKETLAEPKNKLAYASLSTNSPDLILQQPAAVLGDAHIYNVKIPFEGGPVTNQRSSGRCWLFAATNVFRVAIMQKYHLKSFELSQAYLFFWDKVEKANFFLESILDTADEKVDSRIISALMASPVGDGGQWDMAANLVQKYGLVPQTLYPDSWNAQNSGVMDRLLTTKLRENALKLRALKTAQNSGDSSAQASISAAKEKALQEVVRILTLTLGPPPPAHEQFTWEFYDRDGKYNTFKLSPVEFADSLHDTHGVRANGGTDVHSLFSLVNDPRNDYNQLLTVDRLGNVTDGRPVTYVNVDTETIKSATIAMLKKGWPVFFGSDVGKFSDSRKGIMDTALVDYELGFNVKLGLTKAQRLQTGESAMTHAMVLTAVHLDEEGKPVRWRVQNSWGDAAGEAGYFVMTDAWMDEFCYQVVVDPSVVSKEVREVLKQEPKVLNFWDPMGALA